MNNDAMSALFKQEENLEKKVVVYNTYMFMIVQQ